MCFSFGVPIAHTDSSLNPSFMSSIASSGVVTHFVTFVSLAWNSFIPRR